MSLLMMRAAILAQGGAAAPPVDLGSAWELDGTRRPAGYTLSEGNQTAVNTSGGSDYRRWVPTAKAITGWDGKRYWEVLCAPGGAASFDGYLGVVSAEQREEFNIGNNPITRGSIGYRGNGTLWSSNTTTAAQVLTGLAPYGAGDVVMFVFDPDAASLWIGKNGVWRDDPVSGAPTWTAGGSSAFYPQVHGRNSGDGGTLRSLASQFNYAVPTGAQALGFEEPDMVVLAADAWIESGGGAGLGIAQVSGFIEQGGSAGLGVAQISGFIEQGGSARLTCAAVSLYIEVETT